MMAYINLSDNELLRRINSHDAFKELYKRYWKPVRAFIIKMTHDNIFVDDLVQETFLSLYGLQIEQDAKFNLKSYLFLIVRRKVIDYLRKNEKKEECFKSLADHVNDASYSTDGGLILEELKKRIEEGIDQMPEKMKQIFIMSRKLFLKRHEIATKLNISEETVKKQLYLGNKYLRSIIKSVLMLYFVHTLLRLNNFLNFPF